MVTASAELAELRPFFPTALLDGAGWDRLLARVCDLPSEALERCGFELRLNVPEPAADMFVAAVPDSPVGRHFIRQGDAAAPHSPEAALAEALAGACSCGLSSARPARRRNRAHRPRIRHRRAAARRTASSWRVLPVAAEVRSQRSGCARNCLVSALAKAVGWEDDDRRAARRRACGVGVAVRRRGVVCRRLAGANAARNPAGRQFGRPPADCPQRSSA